MPLPSFSFSAIGTEWVIESVEPLTPDTQTEILNYCDKFDATYSRFRDSSLVRRIAEEGEGTYDFPASIVPLYTFYKKLYDVTDGKVTPFVGGLLEDFGYDKYYSLKPKDSTSAIPAWDDVMSLEGTSLCVERPVVLDFGAAGKGFLVDELTRLLKNSGVKEFLIDASGDIRNELRKDQTIGLEDPENSGRVLGAVTLGQQSLCASALNRRQWGDGLHHIVDPKTLKPINDVTATWAIADDTMTADGLATALFFTDPADLQTVASFEFARVLKTGAVEYSKSNKWELYT